jgi:hypothetical protein
LFSEETVAIGFSFLLSSAIRWKREQSGMRLTFVILLVSLPTFGCATMLKGTNEQLMVASDPSGANVAVNGQNEGTTPYETTVPSSQNLQIEVSKPGYQSITIEDDTSFRWGYEIWSFVEFVIPMGVDMADGAAWGHDKTMVTAHLEAASQAPTAASPAALPQSQATPIAAASEPAVTH